MQCAGLQTVSMMSDSIPPCVHCSTSITEMVSPRRLPCNHVFCENCLVGQLGIRDQITCYRCGQVLEEGIPPYSLPLGFPPDQRCSFCLKRDVSSTATHYCGECNKKMCDRHTQVLSKVPELRVSDIMSISRARLSSML